MSNMRISRRTVLRGLGAAVSLPLLDAMAPISARGADLATAPKRMAWIYVPQGTWMPYWMPQTAGPDFELTPCLEPLADFRKEMIVFSGLTCDMARAHGNGGGDHARAGGAFLTGAMPYKTAGANFHSGVSADQVAAQKVGDQTRFPSMELAIESYRGTGNCDSGYSCVYEHTLSWRNATTPLPPEVNPKLVFNRLFADRPDDPRTIARNQLRASILDSVLEDARDLDQKLGGSDRQKLDQYLTSVREIEQRINRAESLPPVQLPDDVSRPAGVPADLAEHFKLQYDLVALAFQTDVTRIATYMLGREGSELKYRMVGVDEGHHTISHHQNRPDNIEKLRAISIFHSGLLADFIRKLRSIPEGEGTLLDNCMICFGSAIADPNSHAHEDLPVLLFGRGGGTVTPGRFIQYPRETPVNNLWVSMLDKFGVPNAQFGDSTGVLEGLS